MYKHNILFIGLDTHKVSTEVAHIEDQRGAKIVVLNSMLRDGVMWEAPKVIN